MDANRLLEVLNKRAAAPPGAPGMLAKLFGGARRALPTAAAGGLAGGGIYAANKAYQGSMGPQSSGQAGIRPTTGYEGLGGPATGKATVPHDLSGPEGIRKAMLGEDQLVNGVTPEQNLAVSKARYGQPGGAGFEGVTPNASGAPGAAAPSIIDQLKKTIADQRTALNGTGTGTFLEHLSNMSTPAKIGLGAGAGLGAYGLYSALAPKKEEERQPMVMPQQQMMMPQMGGMGGGGGNGRFIMGGF